MSWLSFFWSPSTHSGDLFLLTGKLARLSLFWSVLAFMVYFDASQPNRCIGTGNFFPNMVQTNASIKDNANKLCPLLLPSR